MNIFILDYNPVVAAQLQCNKHVVKMPLEGLQIMSTVARKFGVESDMKSTHANHPCTLWAGKYKDNFKWLYEHTEALFKEYTLRYGRTHAKEYVLEQVKEVHNLLPKGSSEFVQCMPEEYKQVDVVKAYQSYYNTKTFAKWKNREIPDWFKLEPETI